MLDVSLGQGWNADDAGHLPPTSLGSPRRLEHRLQGARFEGGMLGVEEEPVETGLSQQRSINCTPKNGMQGGLRPPCIPFLSISQLSLALYFHNHGASFVVEYISA